MANNGAEEKAWNTVFLDNARKWLYIIVLVVGIVFGLIYAQLFIPTNPELTQEVKAIGERMADIQKKMEQPNVAEILEPYESVETTLSLSQRAAQQELLKEWHDAKRDWEALKPLTSRTYRISIHEVFSQQRADLNLYVGGVVAIIGVIAIVATLLSVGMTLSLSRQSDAAEKAVETLREQNTKKMTEEMHKFTADLKEKYESILTFDDKLATIRETETALTSLFDKMNAEIAAFNNQKKEIETFLAQLPSEESYKQLVGDVEELKGQALQVDVEKLKKFSTQYGSDSQPHVAPSTINDPKVIALILRHLLYILTDKPK